MSKRIKILHLEDLATDAELVKRELAKSGIVFESLWVYDEMQYRRALAEFKPEIILCDHSLPSFTSSNALDILKETGARIPFILVTATVSEEFVIAMMKRGIDDYILKDRLQRLPSAVLNALEKVAAEANNDRYYKRIISQEKRFRALIENLCEAILIVNGKGEITYHSPAVHKITGYGGTNILNKSIFDFFYTKDVLFAKQLFDEALSKPGTPVPAAFRIRNKNNRRIYLEGTITNLLSDENVNGFIVNFRDVTKKQEAERLLQKSDANLRTIYNNTSISYILLSSTLHIMSFNEQSVGMLAAFTGERIYEGCCFLDLFTGDRKEVVKRKFENVRLGNKEEYEQELKNITGNTLWLKIDLLPVFGTDKAVLGFIVSAEDITERKSTELEKEKMTADLIQHNKNLEQFAYIISHNLRSPVANIIGLSNMIQNMPDMSQGDFNRCIDGLQISVKKLDETIIDLNYILQIRREINEKKENVKFGDIVKDIITSINNLVEKENIRVNTDFNAVNEFFTIKSYLNSIFFNLISNSIKYRALGRPAVIDVTSQLQGGKIILTFRDNGMGINLKLNHNKIFGLYKKFHPHIEGKGMGLYMVKTQVEILGGNIEVQSEVGAGTSFIITFNL